MSKRVIDAAEVARAHESLGSPPRSRIRASTNAPCSGSRSATCAPDLCRVGRPLDNPRRPASPRWPASIATNPTPATCSGSLVRSARWQRSPRGARLHRTPSEMTGVEARILLAIGNRFPMIRAHKVLAATRASFRGSSPDGSTRQPIEPCGRPRATTPEGHRHLAHHGLSRRGRAPRGYEQGPVRLARTVDPRPDQRHHPHAGYRVERQGDLRRLQRTGAGSRDRDHQPVLRVLEPSRPLRRHRTSTRRVFEHATAGRSDARLVAFVSASGSAGTLGAGDYLKDTYGSRIVAVEALECPTMLENGFGDHNIQGIGDKHVPLIHNVMNTDDVVAVATVRPTRSTPCSTPMRARPISSIGSGSNRRSSTCSCTWATRRSPTHSPPSRSPRIAASVVTMSSSRWRPMARSSTTASARSISLTTTPTATTPWPQRRTSPASSSGRHCPAPRTHRTGAPPGVQPRLLHLGRAAGHIV